MLNGCKGRTDFYFCPYRAIVKCFVVSAGRRPGLRKPLGFQPGAACSVSPCTPCDPWIFFGSLKARCFGVAKTE